MRRVVLSMLLMASMVLAGCFGDGEAIITEEQQEPIWSTYTMIDSMPHEDVRMFLTVDLATNQTTNTSWAVFDKTKGGNCCEHYIATSIEGQIMNIGGEYPVYSADRAHTWDTYIPGFIPDTQCRTFVPTNEGQEGLGEGSIVQATNGDIISMSWFPYLGADLKIDKFYAILYDESEGEWKWCYNRITEPFYDRSWQVEVIGPISSSLGNGEWASVVVSNFWHQTQNAGGQISVDGLNYYPFQFPGRDGGEPSIELDLDFTDADLPAYWDVNKPHKEMRAFPVPSGGLLFPSYFDNGNAAFMDTTLSWNELEVQFPSEYCQIDRTGALHCVANSGTSFTHYMSMDGAQTWTNQTYEMGSMATQIEEWEFQANGEQDLFILNVRYQSSDGPDVDTVFHVRDYSESMAPDTLTYIGQGDLDSTSGAGNDIRFDFASLAILNDGGVVVAYHDSTDPDPLFAVELELPEA
ncbi:MAG TPA: hypothetical protein D7H93_02355 [Candidatus Poseidoniales archaeon]|jgi:hypothetical protein|nr:MAG TPA: hypothetical protein D7H93_02355 [Candidatus Poseidoniales archaeon]HII21549.1 hypothetical protein [Candidatus Poseidoniaceae archaeon]|tara:strand:+ start:1867 stop:3264 length:1398 start_codon:yes stop_codon:yes gene_type:complete